MNIIGIIPSRYGSTRLQAKSLADIHGKPMVQHVYERVLQSTLITRVVVATDDERIAAAVKRFGGESVMTSPSIQSGSDRIAAAAASVDADLIVNIQGDEPLIDPVMIDETIQLLIDDPSAVAGTAVKIITDPDEILNPNIVKVVLDGKMYALYFSRSPIPHVRDHADARTWLNETTFYKHFGLYVYRSAFLRQFTSWAQGTLERAEKLEQLRIMENGHRIKCALTEADSIAVDTQEDLEKVRAVIAARTP
jgi:3-deoxy-manno-octulosonate cytidylyltransferase (CMP-KDO synthetase)